MSFPIFSKFPNSRIVLLAIALAACGQSPEEHFQNAKTLLEKTDYDAAIVELKNVLKDQPENASARVLMGQALLATQEYQDAETELGKARELGAPAEQWLPALAKVYVKTLRPLRALELGVPVSGLSANALARLHSIRAEAQLALGKRTEAEREIAAAEKFDASLPALKMAQATLALSAKQIEQAANILEQALRAEPKSTELLYLKAEVQQADNKFDEAVATYRQIIGIDATQFRAQLGIAQLELYRGKLETADQALQAAEKLAPKAALVRFARGIIEYRRGNLDAADSAFQSTLLASPEHIGSLLGYALTSFGAGRYEETIQKARKVLSSQPDNKLANQLLADSLLQTGASKEALAILEPLLARFPEDARLTASIGQAYLQTKDYNRAMRYFDKATELAPDDAAIRTTRAGGYLFGGNSVQALADFEQAATMSNKLGRADLMLVKMHLQRQEYDQALLSIDQLEKKLPNNPLTDKLRADALIGKKDLAGARKALERAQTSQPGFFPAILGLARLDVLEKKPDLARKRFTGVLAQDPKNQEAMLSLADLAAYEKNDKDYVDWLEKAGEIDKKSVQPRTRLIHYYLKKGDKEKAVKVASDYSEANPESVMALELLASTQLSAGNSSAAVNAYQAISQKVTPSPPILLALALAQIADGKSDLARETLDKALRLQPGFQPAQEALLRLDAVEKNPQAALQIARQMQTQQPRSHVGFEREADLLFAQKRYPEALAAYQQALNKGAGTAGMVKLHRALVVSGDRQGAEKHLGEWLKNHPEDLAARAYAADIYLNTGRSALAIAQYEALLKSAPNNVIALNNLAGLYQRAKDSRALATAESAYRLAPEHPGVQDTLGWLLVEAGQYQRAIELLGKAATKLTELPSVRYHYAVALAKEGKKADARRELSALVETDKKFPEIEEAKALLAQL